MTEAVVTITDKLAALQAISKFIGILGKRRHVTLIDAVSREFALEMAAGAALGLMLPDREWWQCAACATVLDILAPEWRRDASPEILGRVVERNSPEVRQWREAVLTRDGHACRKCGSSQRLHVHHILHWADVPEARIASDNGVTLCEACHIEEHHGLRDAGQKDTSGGGQTDR